MNYKKRMIKGAVLNFLAMSFSQGSTLAANIIVARILLQQSFGQYSLIQNTLLTIVGLSQLATGYTAAKFVAEFRLIDPKKAGRVIGMCATLSIVTATFSTITLIFLSSWLASNTMNAPQLASALILGSAFLFFSILNGYQMGVLSGLEAFTSLAKAGLLSGILAISAITIGAFYGGLNGAIIGVSFSAFFRLLVHQHLLRLELKKQKIQFNYFSSLGEEKNIVLNFSLPAAIAGCYTMPIIWLSNTFLVHEQDGYNQMALYSAANSFRILVLFLPNVINNVGLSLLNNEKGKGNQDQYHNKFKSNLSHIIILTIFVAALICVFAKQALGLYGPDFKKASIMLLIILFGSVFEGSSMGMYQYIQTKSKIWAGFFFINVPRDLGMLLFAYFLIHKYGGIGLAMSYFLSALMGFILTIILVRVFWRKK